MGIRFGVPSKKTSFYQVLIPDPGNRYFVKIGYKRELHRETDLHFLTEANRSVPCLHADCRFHHLPARSVVYVPALVFIDPNAGFRTALLLITDSGRDILDTDLKNWLFMIRRKGAKNSPVLWTRQEQVPKDVQPFEGVDIEPSLLRAWGYNDVDPVERGEPQT